MHPKPRLPYRVCVTVTLALVCSLTANAESQQREVSTTVPDPGRSVPPSLSASSFSTDVGLARGWPVDLGLSSSGYPYTPSVFDADGDRADEIFVTGGETFGLRGDGSFLRAGRRSR